MRFPGRFYSSFFPNGFVNNKVYAPAAVSGSKLILFGFLDRREFSIPFVH